MGMPTRSRGHVGPSSTPARSPTPLAGAWSEKLALDLVNTVTTSRGVRRDRLATGGDMVAWMLDSNLLEHQADRFALRAPSIARLVHDEARRLRGAIRDVFHAHRNGDPLPPDGLHVVNSVLAAGRTAHSLESGPDGFRICGVQHARVPAALLVPVAFSAAAVVTRVAPTRLGLCAAEGCDTWFVDTSKGGRRRWCSMAACGNRAKATRHRRRHVRSAYPDAPSSHVPLPPAREPG